MLLNSTQVLVFVIKYILGEYMDNTSAKKLSLEEKTLLTCGDGSWHTHSVGDIPSIMMTDGPHGLRKQSDTPEGINDSSVATCFPTACAVASSWNRENAKKIAECIADEAICEGVSVVLGPGVNIKRSPLCGRNFEYFSEDPVLAGRLADAYVSAMQKKGVGSCLKHFAVNSQETRRMTVDAIVDERALREIYLAAFQYVVERSNPWAIMASYNKVNGTYATENSHLLNEILRKEWRFDGLVMSDWGASYNTPAAIRAGMDLEMPEDKSGYHRQTVINAVNSGELEEEYLDIACERVQNLVNKCNNVRKTEQKTDLSRHNALCKEVAADSAVLLKNNGLLPLDVNADFCVVGELAEKPRFQGAGSSHINCQAKSFLQVLQENGKTACFAKGYGIDIDKESKKLQKEAVALAKKHKVVLFFGGLTDIFEGEGYDRKTLEIPENQKSLLKKLRAVNENVVFVAFGGSPFTMPWLDDVGSLLHMYLGGQAVMEAAHDLLFGLECPSGRLAETYPLKLEDTPCFNYFANDSRFDEHRESVFVGYRYYNTFDVPVLFPFGFGLSYAKFDHSDLRVKQEASGFEVSVNVTNLSDKNAAEVVQLYVDNCNGNVIRPKRELKEFCKVRLAEHETKKVVFHLTERAFAVYKKDVGFVAVNGKYDISVCSNVEETLLSKSVTVSFGTDADFGDRENYPDYFKKSEGNFTVSDEQFFDLTGWYKPKIEVTKRGRFTLINTFEDLAPKVGLVRLILRFAKRIAAKQSPTKKLSDPVAQMILGGCKETPLISMMSIAGVPAKYVKYILYHSNRNYIKAFKALCGKYKVE